MKKNVLKIINNLCKNRHIVFFGLLLIFHMFFRFYGFEDKSNFGWDQVDNAWAAKNIIVEHRLPLVGMVAKQNSGFYIGPLYYYYVAIFYLLTRLDPVASILIAGVTSTIGFFVLYIFVKKLFSEKVALVAVFFHTFSSFIIASDKVQWPVNFLAPISIIIFYLLYQVMLGKGKNILFLTIFLGISWQLNFTAIFFFLITLLTLPFFPRTKESLKYSLLSIPVLLVFFLPNIIYDVQNKGTSSRHLSAYAADYSHGFHLRRFLQLAPDAFIEFASLFQNWFLKLLRYLSVPLFFVMYLWRSRKRNRLLFCYLIFLWYFVPWIVFTLYKGEISNYYFSLTRPITLMLIAFLLVSVFQLKYKLVKGGLLFILCIYAVINTQQYFKFEYSSLSSVKNEVRRKIANDIKVKFNGNDAQSYIYYVFAEYGKTTKSNTK